MSTETLVTSVRVHSKGVRPKKLQQNTRTCLYGAFRFNVLAQAVESSSSNYLLG